jgi:hypothetical protein
MRRPVTAAPPTPGATSPERAPATDIPVRAAHRCTCGHGPILHTGTDETGPCLLPRCGCAAYQEGL